MNPNSEAREHFLTGAALMVAVAVDQSLPAEKRQFSDTCDRLKMLRAMHHCADLADYAASVKRKIGLIVDLYEDVRPDQLTPHRQNFAAAMARRAA